MTENQLKTLRELISESGYKKVWISEQLGLSKEGFRKKLTGKIRFNLSEIERLSTILSLTDEERQKIFYR